MDSGMNSIESMYLNYSGLLEEFSEDVIRSRYAFLYKECMEFLKSQKLESEVRLDEVLLMHAVLEQKPLLRCQPRRLDLLPVLRQRFAPTPRAHLLET